MTTIKLPSGREVEVRETLADRVVAWASPRAGLDRLRARYTMELATGGVGGYNAGRRDRRNLRSWRPQEGSANADTLLDLPDLRARSRDLARNAPFAGGAISTAVTNVVGEGLTVTPVVDRTILNLSDEQAEAFESAARAEWRMWCDCADHTKTQSFGEMQALAFRAVLESGDLFAVRRYRKDPGEAYGLKMLLLEADRVSNPGRAADRQGMIGGVAFDGDGVATGYSISNRHPGDTIILGGALEWQTAPARDADGRPLVLHLFERLRPDQARGVPFLAPVIEKLAELAKYSDAEATAAIVSAMLTVFIKNTNEGGEDEAPAIGERGVAGNATNEVNLGAGAVVDLGLGQEPVFVNPSRPNPEFGAFVESLVRQIGVGLELPYEILIKHFTASYSASRAALETAWQFFRKRRTWLAQRLCQPVYEAFLYEAVAEGRLAAPGFFSDPLIMRAWCGARWRGPARISLDQYKDAQADALNLTNRLTTREAVMQERFGTTPEETFAQLGEEQRAMDAAGLAPPPAPAGTGRELAEPAAPTEPAKDGGTDTEEADVA
jgi:lambda family phage portal protein